MEPTNQLGTTLSLSSGPLPLIGKVFGVLKGSSCYQISIIQGTFSNSEAPAAIRYQCNLLNGSLRDYVLHPTLMREIKNDRNWIFFGIIPEKDMDSWFEGMRTLTFVDRE